MHVLSASVLLSLSSLSSAELVNNLTGQAAISWSSEDVSQLLNNDSASTIENAVETPQATTTVTTTIRQSNGVVNQNPSSQSVRILDTNSYSSQPSVNARAALVMDAQTGEVLYSKNTNTALPIASVTKLMTAVVIADAKLIAPAKNYGMILFSHATGWLPAKAFWPSRHRLRCRWQLDPARSASNLAINVMESPMASANSLVPMFISR